MDDEQLLARFSHLASYLGFGEGDVERIKSAKPLVELHFDALVTDFYNEIDRHQETSQVITGGEAQSSRLRGTLKQWLSQLFDGDYDLAYIRRRWNVGRRHVEIGLDQTYTHVAMSRLRTGILKFVQTSWLGSSEALCSTNQSICRILDLDLALIQLAYEMELLRKQQQAERLAAIGQMAGGIAHELRNPLNVLQTSLYLLQHSPKIDPAKQQEHAERMQRQIKLANGTITALSEFTRLGSPRTQMVQVKTLIDDVLRDSISSSNVAVISDVSPTELVFQADTDQMAIVLRNLVCNAIEAMGSEEGEVRIVARQVESLRIPGHFRLRIDVIDQGGGIPEEVRLRLTEPLFTTKARGLGLGLALVHAIVEKHQGELHVRSEPGKGSTFTIDLPM